MIYLKALGILLLLLTAVVLWCLPIIILPEALAIAWAFAPVAILALAGIYAVILDALR